MVRYPYWRREKCDCNLLKGMLPTKTLRLWPGAMLREWCGSGVGVVEARFRTKERGARNIRSERQ